MATFYLVQNDKNITMTTTLKDAEGSAIDLTDATVTFHLGYEGEPSSVLVEGLCTIVDAENGRVSYTWTAEDTNLEAGVTYDAEFQIAYGESVIRTVPTKSGGFKVVVRGEVG
jgi:TPP-dependent indolepyruvate ferredoxin oxidoreductase alpha subunit